MSYVASENYCNTQKEHKFDILAVSRLIEGTIYREKN